MERLRLVAAGQRSKGFEWGFCFSAFAIAFGARYYLEGALPPGFPYLTFFPAVILTGFFASTRAGSVVAVLCGLASWYFFLAPQGSWALTWPSVLALAFYVFIVSTDLFLIHVMRMALTKLGDERATSIKLAQSNKLMFHELQHRVSNNLQVISSLLKMQQRNLTNDSAKQALETASARLQVVSNIQRQLHNPKRQSSDIGQVLRDVLPEVVSSSGEEQRVRLQFDTQPLVVTGDQATPIALVAVELVSNALEHGIGIDQDTTIRIETLAENGWGTLRVSDDGKGLPDDFQPERSRSLGLRIAHQFTEQLGGTLRFETQNGTQVTLEFPLDQTAPLAS